MTHNQRYKRLLKSSIRKDLISSWCFSYYTNSATENPFKPSDERLTFKLQFHCHRFGVKYSSIAYTYPMNRAKRAPNSAKNIFSFFFVLFVCVQSTPHSHINIILKLVRIYSVLCMCIQIIQRYTHV